MVWTPHHFQADRRTTETYPNRKVSALQIERHFHWDHRMRCSHKLSRLLRCGEMIQVTDSTCPRHRWNRNYGSVCSFVVTGKSYRRGSFATSARRNSFNIICCKGSWFTCHQESWIRNWFGFNARPTARESVVCPKTNAPAKEANCGYNQSLKDFVQTIIFS